MKTNRPPIYVYELGGDYSDCIVATSEKKLREVIEAALRGTRKFEGGLKGTVLGVSDTFEGHARRAFDTRRLLNLATVPAHALFIRREQVEGYVDGVTLAAFDAACGFFVRSSLLTFEAVVNDSWPGQSEWFLHADIPAGVTIGPTFKPVKSTLVKRAAVSLNLPESSFEITVLGPTGSPLEADLPGRTFGTFLVALGQVPGSEKKAVT